MTGVQTCALPIFAKRGKRPIQTRCEFQDNNIIDVNDQSNNDLRVLDSELVRKQERKSSTTINVNLDVKTPNYPQPQFTTTNTAKHNSAHDNLSFTHLARYMKQEPLAPESLQTTYRDIKTNKFADTTTQGTVLLPNHNSLNLIPTESVSSPKSYPTVAYQLRPTSPPLNKSYSNAVHSNQFIRTSNSSQHRINAQPGSAAYPPLQQPLEEVDACRLI